MLQNFAVPFRFVGDVSEPADVRNWEGVPERNGRKGKSTGTKPNGMERNGTERNGTNGGPEGERNGTERNAERNGIRNGI